MATPVNNNANNNTNFIEFLYNLFIKQGEQVDAVDIEP